MHIGTTTSASVANPAFTVESRNGRPDFELAAALQKFSPQAQTKAKATATDFEAMFLNSMFSQMTSGIKGEGPFGDTPGTGVSRGAGPRPPPALQRHAPAHRGRAAGLGRGVAAG